ncbi:MAG: hypothetical protein WCH05_05500 [Chlorobiaceae bacterium]
MTCSRRLRHFQDVVPSEQPAMFVTQTNQTVQQVTGMPSVATLEAQVWIYTNDPDPSHAPAAQINDLLDQIDAALAPPLGPAYKQTLGGLCEHCWIDGQIEIDEGTLGEQSLARFTIKILTTI